MFMLKYLKSMGIILLGIVISSLVITLFNYFNFFSSTVINVLELAGLIISVFIGSFYLGKRGVKRGYLEGIKIGVALSFLMFIFSYLAFGYGIKLATLIYYIIITISAAFGSVVGINKKLSR